MSPRLGKVVCGACDGTRKTPTGLRCPECDGYGELDSTGARDALGHVVGDATVALLDEHRAEVVAWLAEEGVLRVTRWAWEFVPRDETQVPWADDYVRPGTTHVVEGLFAKNTPHWLYTVEVES